MQVLASKTFSLSKLEGGSRGKGADGCCSHPGLAPVSLQFLEGTSQVSQLEGLPSPYSWCSPHKSCQMLFPGTQKLLSFAESQSLHSGHEAEGSC